MKTSEGRNFSKAHFSIVSLLDIESRGMGAEEDNILYSCSQVKLDDLFLTPSLMVNEALRRTQEEV